jgi:hypothetical protein
MTAARVLRFGAALSAGLTAAIAAGVMSWADPPPAPEPKTEPKTEPKNESKAEPKAAEAPVPEPKPEPKPAEMPKPVEPAPAEEPKKAGGNGAAPDEGGSLRDRILGPVGGGPPRVEVVRLPEMSMKGYLEVVGRNPVALLQIQGIAQPVRVRKGDLIPVVVVGRIVSANPLPARPPVSGGGASGRETPASVAPGSPAAGEQTQVYLKVLEVTAEGVTVEAELLSQRLMIR